MDDSRMRRIAQNEASFRDINERLETSLRTLPPDGEHVSFICECGREDCEQHVQLSLEEYEAIRRDSRHFAVVPGHAIPQAERVIATHDRYEIVEKIQAGARLADARDKRVPGPGGQRAGTEGE
jgi:hypothetical protein